MFRDPASLHSICSCLHRNNVRPHLPKQLALPAPDIFEAFQLLPSTAEQDFFLFIYDEYAVTALSLSLTSAVSTWVSAHLPKVQ